MTIPDLSKVVKLRQVFDDRDLSRARWCGFAWGLLAGALGFAAVLWLASRWSP